MFTAIGNFFAFVASFFEALRIGGESINDLAKVGRVKTLSILDESLQAAGDLSTVASRLEASGIDKIVARPTPAAKQAKRIAP